jgi:hypothetical protein
MEKIYPDPVARQFVPFATLTRISSDGDRKSRKTFLLPTRWREAPRSVSQLSSEPSSEVAQYACISVELSQVSVSSVAA